MYQEFIDRLKKELVPAMGCTEPIAIAYAGAVARRELREFPDTITVRCSGNIIKNVKGVVVPTTGDMKGIETSAVLGALAGNADDKLEVLSGVKPDHIDQTKELLIKGICRVELAEGVENLYIEFIAVKGKDNVRVIIADTHTNIVLIEKNGETCFETKKAAEEIQKAIEEDQFTVRSIYDFANAVKVEDVKEILDRQIQMNMRIAVEGIENRYGANVGKSLIKHYGEDIKVLAKAYAAAGSDARMSGCEMPVVINSGSGNQGITVSVPVIVYAKHLSVSDEMLCRALVISNLLAIHLKTGIGKLSAYCGAVSAACGCGAAISYLYGAPYEIIANTLTNILANVSGIVCDGAKPSCAAKIASSVDAAILGHSMAMDGMTFGEGEGLVKKDIEETIHSIWRLGKEGMKDTDVEILNIMIGADGGSAAL